MTSEPVRQAVGELPDEPPLGAAPAEPPISGVHSSDINVVAGRRSVERKLGARSDDVAALEDDPEAPVTLSHLPRGPR